MNHTLYYLFSVGVKYGTISLCAYFIFYTALPQKPPARRHVAVILCLFLYAVGISLLRDWIHPFQATVTLAVFMLIVCAVLKIRLKEAAALSLISLGGSYAAYFVAVMAGAILIGYTDQMLFPGGVNMLQMIMQENSLLDTLSFLLLSLLQMLLLFLFLRSKYIKKGLAAIFKYGSGAGGLYVSIMMIAAMTCCALCIAIYPAGTYPSAILGLIFLCIFSLIFWIRHEIKAVYLLRNDNAICQRMEQSLSGMKQQKDALLEDNKRMAAIIDEDGRLIPAMVKSVRECVAHIDGTEQDKSTFLETALQLEEIHAERMAALAQYERHSGTSSKENPPSP